MDSTLRPPSSLQEWAAGMTDAQLHALAGAVGGVASGVFTCPFDVIKIRLQSQGSFVPIHTAARTRVRHKMYQGLVKTSRVIWRKEGIRGMYRGMGPLLLGYLPTWAIWFTAYQHCKQKLPQMYRE
jgi:solute carrier family 25 (mitochondrial folate transporter), member 32